ncbi:hypothetical protein [Pseudoalteromonas spongiae]|uniref:hypothetical protein n=1 Tax=Pseudoalteromonas spongiae TaxID=298657 RepID=UPI00110B3C4D|nr:hypothetical protein [Pseudoalteromonas spongiae]TMO82171.1 hypothetical protein CWC15_19955 [Pseudoalteromonas spongiae]
MKCFIPSVIAAAIILSGCGGSSSSNSVDNTSLEVHAIKPADVASYIENYTQLATQLNVQIDGHNSAIEMLDFDMDEGVIYIRYDLGVIVLGFDFEGEKPKQEVAVITNQNTEQALLGENLQLSEQNENFVLEGQLVDNTSGNLHTFNMTFNESLISGGNSQLVVKDTAAELSGTLGSKTYVQFRDLALDHPSVNRIIFKSVDGSVNDDINMHTGRLIHQAQYTTVMPADGEAYSGGVDLYAAGIKKEYQVGGKLGVHAWCCEGDKDAGQLSKSHSAHGAQLTYFREILGQELGPEFYFFTINAAPADDIYLMTQAEINKYFF